ncbi:DnaJ domain-containing protein [Pseudomonas sp.]|uniref:J domain-containing protein n=1 Tax=Pseudomonas sp. TaxID=306 RepID=UPI0028A92183|nr:DnaJ domain-containing protein [Pseudomonas sp.]
MHSDKADPKGYYSVLGLLPSATEAQIKTAYRRRAMDLHPDRNPGRDTTQQFQHLNDAYAVLSDPAARARYEAYLIKGGGSGHTASAAPTPIVCAGCAKISAQPRVVVFPSVRSFLLVTVRKPIAGVFCSECAHKAALKASAVTWVLGWWSIPWGPLYSLQALATNLLGGTQPPLDNARMLGHQAYYFRATGRPDLAQSLAQHALEYCRKIPNTLSKGGAAGEEKTRLTHNLEALIRQLGAPAEAKQLKNSWGLLHARFFVQAAALVLVVAGVAVGVANTSLSRYFTFSEPAPSSAQPLAEDATGLPGPDAVRDALRNLDAKPAYVRPATAPNGLPWPHTAGYLAGEPQAMSTGYSQIVIDNGRNTADVLLKLVALQGDGAQTARQVFVPAHGRFTLEHITPGRYDVRYRDLDSGELSRSQPLQLTEKTTARGTEYNITTVTLYKVASGQSASLRLSEDEF